VHSHRGGPGGRRAPAISIDKGPQMPQLDVPAGPRPRRIRPSARRPLTLAVALAAAAAALAPAAARADTGWTAAPLTVADGAAGEEVAVGKRLRNDLALAPDGSAWIAWAQTDDQSNSTADPADEAVRVSRRTAGGAWEPPQAIATVTRAGGSNFTTLAGPRIAVDAAGRPTVAWGERTSASSVTVKVASLRADGTWSAPVALGTVAALSGPFPIALDVAADGAAAVAWQGSGAVELAVRPSAAGSWSATSETVDATTVDVADQVGIGRDQDGTLTLVWRTGSGNSARELKSRTRTAGGSFGATVTLTTAAGFVSRPAVEVDATGAAVATWGSDDGPRAAARPAGGAWGAPVVLASGSANAATTQIGAPARMTGGTGIPSAAFDAHGNATVVWPEAPDGATPSRVRAQRFGADGAWGPAETVAEETAAANPPVWPRVALGPDGSATVAWTSRVLFQVVGGAPMLSGGAVRASTRTAGGAWSAPVTFTTASSGSYGTTTALGLPDDANLTLAADALGNAALGWTPYVTAAAPAARTNESAHFEAAVAPRLDWTARGLTGASNLRTWVNYLHTDWAGPGPVGAKGVETSGGASQPDANDRSSWRLTFEDAWREPDGGPLVARFRGTIRWVNSAHFIDSTIADPRLEIAADGRSARLYVDGRASGSMADAMAGRPTWTTVSNVRLLDLDLTAAGPRTSGDGSVRTWVAAPARASPAGTSVYGMDSYAARPFGFMTFTLPADPPVRTPSVEQPPTEQPPTEQPPSEQPPTERPPVGRPPAEQPRRGGEQPSKQRALTGAIRGSKAARRTVVVRLSRQVGVRAGRTYRVVLRRGKTIVASGTLKGRALRLTAARLPGRRGARPRYRRLTGRWTLASPAKVGGKRLPQARRIAATTVTIR